MHKIISLKKEITFKNTIEEIVSISMDNKLCLEDLLVKGDFVVEGEYLTLSKKEPFHFNIPYLGYLDEYYDSCEATVKVDDFYYEIIEPNKLLLAIDILVDNLLERAIIDDIPNLEKEDLEKEDLEERVIEAIAEEVKEEKKETNRVEKSNVDDVLLEDKTSEREVLIFKDNYQEAYMTYKVYIVREGDTVESILDKYSISLETLNKYNVINELNVGDKLIISNEKSKWDIKRIKY